MVFTVTSSNSNIKIARSSEFYLKEVEDDLEINIFFKSPDPRREKTSMPMNLSSLSLSSTLGDVFINMYFIS